MKFAKTTQDATLLLLLTFTFTVAVLLWSAASAPDARAQEDPATTINSELSERSVALLEEMKKMDNTLQQIAENAVNTSYNGEFTSTSSRENFQLSIQEAQDALVDEPWIQYSFDPAGVSGVQYLRDLNGLVAAITIEETLASRLAGLEEAQFQLGEALATLESDFVLTE